MNSGCGQGVVEGNEYERGYVSMKCNIIRYVSCYFTPKETIADFQPKLNHLEDKVRETFGPAIVGGNVNVKAEEHSMELTDAKGRCVEIVIRLGIDFATTFRKLGYGETISDIKPASEVIAWDILDWRDR